MGALRIFRRNMERKGKAKRISYKFPGSNLKNLPLHIREKANYLGHAMYSLCVWKDG